MTRIQSSGCIASNAGGLFGEMLEWVRVSFMAAMVTRSNLKKATLLLLGKQFAHLVTVLCRN